jgi:3-oxoacyl-[acyl-carrier protein] reductase
MDLGLTGRVAVVMAASRGLGRATAQALAAEGCDLAIASRDPARIEAAAADIRARSGRRVLAAAVDVTRADAIAAFAEQVQAAYGRTDILVNNGGGPPPGTFDQLDDTQWAAAAELLVMNVVRTTRAFLPHLRATAANPGPAGACARIITLTSTSTREVIANLMLSNSLRAAVAGWSKTLARELASEGITVNCIAPGSIGTERIDELVAANAARAGTTSEQARAALLARIPAGRFGRPEEFAAAAAFLAGKPASYISGTTVVVDGAMTATVA